MMILKRHVLLTVPLLLAACAGPSKDTAPDTLVDETDPTETDEPTPLMVTSSGPIECVAPTLPGGPFYQSARADIVNSDLPFILGAGLVVAELNGDGILDSVHVNQRIVQMHHPLTDPLIEPSVLYTIGDTEDRKGLFGASAADYDGDGDFDLYITNHPGPNVLLNNDGAGNFTEVTATAGVVGPTDHWSAASDWADIDRDGDLDLVVSGYGLVNNAREVNPAEFEPADPTLLYENQGDGTFVDITDRIAADRQGGYTFLAGFHDINDDMWPDLYFSNDFASDQVPSHALLNQNGSFVADTSLDGLSSAVIGMGLGAGDLNGDGYVDFLIPGWNDLAVLVSQDDTWFDVSQLLGVEPDSSLGQKIAWGSEFIDLNNDGRLDIYVSFGYLDSRQSANALQQPDAMYFQTDDMVFTPRAHRLGLDHGGSTRTAVFADLDDDGWLDIIKASTDVNIYLLRAFCAEHAWLRVSLDQPGLNRFGIGARLRATVGDTTQVRRIAAGGTGWASSGPPRAHFGFGEHALIDQLEITWPDGRVDVLTDVPTREILTLTRP